MFKTDSGCGPAIYRLVRLSSPGYHSQAALECSKTQLQIQQPATCWVPLVNPGLSTPKNWEESRWGRRKGSVCFDFFFFFLFTRLSSSGKRKESRSELVPCQASSPPLLVQALHRLCRLQNSNFWKHTGKSGPVQKQ